MMVMSSSRERTPDEYVDLLKGAGFAAFQATPIDAPIGSLVVIAAKVP
jgi:hypothetical protein